MNNVRVFNMNLSVDSGRAFCDKHYKRDQIGGFLQIIVSTNEFVKRNNKLGDKYEIL